MSDGFELVVSGHKETAFQMGELANKALTIGQLRKIGRKAFKEMTGQAKRNIRSLDRRDKRDIAKAARVKTPKGRGRNRIKGGKIRILSLGLDQSKLPTISSRTGKPYKAFGKSGVPVGRWVEMGTKERIKRGKMRAEWPFYRAYKQKRQKVRLETKKGIEKRLNEYSNSLTKLDYKFK